MSAKTEAFMDRAKAQTIGCEIEMAEITRNMAIKTVARYFGTLETVHHDGGAYDAWSCRDTQGRVWKVMRDVSISASTDTLLDSSDTREGSVIQSTRQAFTFTSEHKGRHRRA